ncbi:TPA: STM4504/CBY_0614 family protein [Enterobacter cloacae]
MFYKRFSRRRNEALGNIEDVYSYDDIPIEARVQIATLWGKIIHKEPNLDVALYRFICEELGVHSLPVTSRKNSWGDPDVFTDLVNFFCHSRECDGEICIDLLDMVSFVFYSTFAQYRMSELQPIFDKINFRLQCHGVGYRVEEGHLIRLDTEFAHSEIIKPSIATLGSSKKYQSAFEQFIQAFEHYKANKLEEAIVSACKAYESTLKIILKDHDIALNGNETISQLVPKLFSIDGIPPFLQDGNLKLSGMLQAYIGTIRNKIAAHGTDEPRNVEVELVSFMINLTGSNITFLTKVFR